MQNMSMNSPGQGQGNGSSGQGFQLPDIIQKQQSLSQQMQNGMQEGGKQEGEEGKDGDQGKGQQGQGEDGNQGQGQGQEGQGKGEQGKSGEGTSGGDGNGASGNNGKNGKEGKEDSKGDPNQEFLNGQLYEIYKQQQDLRNQLQDRLSKEGLDGRGGQIIKEMEGIEQMLLEKGFNSETLKRMQDLQYELLKLDEADFEQGKENKRESQTNRNDYENNLRLNPNDIKKYFNQKEILNREALPLQQEYKKEVQRYFDNSND